MTENHTNKNAAGDKPRGASCDTGGDRITPSAGAQVEIADFRAMERKNLLGMCTLRLGGVRVTGCRLLRGPRGVFLGLPEREYEKDGERRWARIVFLDDDLYYRTQDAVRDFAIEQGLEDGAGAPGAAAAAEGGEVPDGEIPF